MEKNWSLLEELVKYTVPELCDGMETYRIMDWQIKPWVGRPRIAGYALTVEVPAGESGIVPDAICAAGKGDVIVIAGKGDCRLSYWGDHRSLCAGKQGAVGVIVDGAFRDLEGCEEEGFPVFARALTCRSAGKAKTGAIGVPVECGGVTVCPGDLIVADVNGICVLKEEEVPAILTRTRNKIRSQAYTRQEMERTGKVIPRILPVPEPEEQP